MLLLFFLLPGCGDSEPVTGPDPAAAHVAAGRLCTLFGKEGIECAWEGSTAKTDKGTVEVTATVDKEVTLGKSITLELTYDIALDGKSLPGLRGSAVGSGFSRDETHGKAADDWARVYGSAVADRVLNTGRVGVLQALQDEQDPPPAFVVGEWVAYPGWTELRGKRTEKKMIDIQGLLDTVSPKIAAWPKEADATHGLLIQFRVEDSHPLDKECTLDGEPSVELCDLALTYDFPEGSYLLKQYFAFAPGPLPEGVEERARMPSE